MSSLDADVNINLNANDNASPVVDQSVKNIDRSFVQMRNGLRANERSFYLQHQSIFKFNQLMGTLRNVTGAGVGALNTILLSQIRNEAAAKNLRDALRDEADALAEFGPGSREFNDAHEKTTEILKDQENQLKQDILQWVTLGTYLTTAIIPALTKILSRGRAISRLPPVPLGGGAPVITPVPGGGGGAVQGPNLPKGGLNTNIGGAGLFGILSLAQFALGQIGITPNKSGSDSIGGRFEAANDYMNQTVVNVTIDGKTYQGVYN